MVIFAASVHVLILQVVGWLKIEDIFQIPKSSSICNKYFLRILADGLRKLGFWSQVYSVDLKQLCFLPNLAFCFWHKNRRCGHKMMFCTSESFVSLSLKDVLRIFDRNILTNRRSWDDNCFFIDTAWNELRNKTGLEENNALLLQLILWTNRTQNSAAERRAHKPNEPNRTTSS